MNKLILILLILLININLAYAQGTLIELPDTDSEENVNIEDNIFTKIKCVDNTDRITELKIGLKPNLTDLYTDTAISVNISNNFTYSIIETNFKYLYIIPYHTITHLVTYQNYSVFVRNYTVSNLIPQVINAEIKYDINSQNTTFKIYTSVVSSDEYDTKMFIGMPANEIIVRGMTPFDLDIKYADIGNKIDLANQIESLSSISKFLYDVMTLKVPIINKRILGDSELLINILSTVDIFFMIITVMFKIIFIYPYLILFLIISIGNLASGFKSRTIKEFIDNLKEYYIAVGKLFYNIFTFVVDKILKLISAITNLF